MNNEKNTAANEAIAAEFYEQVINNRDIDTIDKFLTDDFIHNGVSRGISGQRAAVEMFLNAFSPLVNTIEISFSSGELVCVHENWKGIHTGEFMGVAATGKNVEWSSTAILKFSGGKICRAWDENDFLGLFQQIGKYPDIK